ncbi:MAG: hypothetical protein IJU68_06775 [Bacteroidales bacterium]|nr:hypothetical protein [Bacteroidales bacterium]
MKKLLLTVILALSATVFANAHDVIVKLNGEQIKAMVMEVSDTTVKFKRMDDPNGPVYVLKTSDIQHISYESGRVEIYNEAPPAPNEQKIYAERYDVRYRDIKHMYRPSDYARRVGDPYDPTINGVASFFLPGLGQCIDGEWGRGIGIFAANIGFTLLECAEASLMFYSGAEGASYYKNYGTVSSRPNITMGASLFAAIVTASAHLAFNIWNICDAVNIAKVKNLYYQDAYSNSAALDIHLEPQLAFSPVSGNSLQPTAGLKLSVCF